MIEEKNKCWTVNVGKKAGEKKRKKGKKRIINSKEWVEKVRRKERVENKEVKKQKEEEESENKRRGYDIDKRGRNGRVKKKGELEGIETLAVVEMKGKINRKK